MKNFFLDIAVAASANSKRWVNKRFTWQELTDKLQKPVVTSETYKEYMAAPKEDQDRIKDVGGYFGGFLRGGRRKLENVIHRQLVCLDIDHGSLEFWEDFKLLFDCVAVMHSTHKHSEKTPRYRLLIPMDREMSADEYVAVSRRIAGDLNIEIFDNTTFDVNRLMYWPSVSKDVAYVFNLQDSDHILSVDAVLGQYRDWTDSSQWPVSTSAKEKIRSDAKKQEDPEAKRGVVGAFCRAYGIEEAIITFLADEYTRTTDGRYTYTKGSTAGGLVIYEDKFAFSHHGTDPTSGKLTNAFDLVRIHKFGHLDTVEHSKKSYSAMEEFCRADKKVKSTIASEAVQEAKFDFQDDFSEEEIQESLEWMQELDVNALGKYLSNANNINLIFKNDIRLKGLFRYNRFDRQGYICASAPWRKIDKPEPLRNVDDAGVRNYIEVVYGISNKTKIEDSMALELERNSFHPVVDYLETLEWDGTERIDSLLIDYFGADDNIYSREAIRKMLVGAVARVYHPGVKYDLSLVLAGPEGHGKSTFISKLGGEFFSDTFFTVQGKEALEQIQGVWLMEMAELTGLKKAEVESIKQFLSKQVDKFRPAYMKKNETFPRQCVFFGTTNNSAFLKDSTGKNRRFMPVDVIPERVKKNVWKDLTKKEVDQIWAEAVFLYENGETLYLSKEADLIADSERRDHAEIDERQGIVEEYLDTPLPKTWDSMDIYDRRSHLENPPKDIKGLESRKYVTVAEIWCECLGRPKEEMDRYKTREINDIMKTLQNWEPGKTARRFKHYGMQRYYVRKE